MAENKILSLLKKKKVRIPVFIASGILLVTAAVLIIHYVYIPDGYYFWEELPGSNCRHIESSIQKYQADSGGNRITDYEYAFNGDAGWITYFGKVSMRKEADKNSDVVTYVTFKNKIGTFGDEVNGYYYAKYMDSVSGKIFSGYISKEYITREEIQSPKIYLDVPKYMQTDTAWGDIKIGGYETLESAGCTTTCLAMSYSCIKREEILPSDVAADLQYDYHGNLTFPDEYIKYNSRDFISVMYAQLEKGIPVLVGCFRRSGFPHWCIVYGYNGDGEKLKKENFMVFDPYNPDRANLQEFFDTFPVFNKIVYYNS